MDPNANLKEQIELAKEAIECGGFAHPEDAVRLAALVIAFDEWMRKGGFLPDTWTLSANENAQRSGNGKRNDELLQGVLPRG